MDYSHASAMMLSKPKSIKTREMALTEEISNLQFQLMYGDSKKDEEIAELKDRLEQLQRQFQMVTNDSEVQKLKQKLSASRDKQIEDWLFSGDLSAESL
eukprot:TRINITY_DN6650_c0_g1_i1.p1 TRINITY_DN6650_c0_g1~~TRINITY_DN6650_c0_g1_i1.p1  ORF type:complete len:115 (-),score=32.26 TRINITY_DN6650_c0_g1_i1:38-334(-)